MGPKALTIPSQPPSKDHAELELGCFQQPMSSYATASKACSSPLKKDGRKPKNTQAKTRKPTLWQAKGTNIQVEKKKQEALKGNPKPGRTYAHLSDEAQPALLGRGVLWWQIREALSARPGWGNRCPTGVQQVTLALGDISCGIVGDPWVFVRLAPLGCPFSPPVKVTNL